MRIFQNLVEAYKEAERDLWEMGIDVTPMSMQDKKAQGDEFKTKEIQGFGFTVVPHTPDDWALTNRQKVLELAGIPIEYCEIEVDDRMKDMAQNPGRSFHLRPDIWKEFMHEGKFSYTYSERMEGQVASTLRRLAVDPENRQGIIAIYNPSIDTPRRGGEMRIPCSMYYQLMIRGGKLDLIYTMRSCDFLTHFAADIYMATRIMDYASAVLGVPIGKFMYFTGSLHAYYKDLEARGIF